MATLVNNTLLHTRKLLRIDLKCSHHKQEKKNGFQTHSWTRLQPVQNPCGQKTQSSCCEDPNSLSWTQGSHWVSTPGHHSVPSYNQVKENILPYIHSELPEGSYAQNSIDRTRNPQEVISQIMWTCELLHLFQVATIILEISTYKSPI